MLCRQLFAYNFHLLYMPMLESPILAFHVLDEMIVRPSPVVIAHQIFEAVSHCHRDAFVSLFLSPVLGDAIFDDCFCLYVHLVVLLFDILEKDVCKHVKPLFFLFAGGIRRMRPP